MLTRFNDDMIVLEKWNPEKPISVVHYVGDKERFYLKRFLIENPNREEVVIDEDPKSYLELVSTDWRPRLEIEFVKPRGKDPKPNLEVNVEDFIAIKGIKALGNQLTPEKVKNINTMEPLPFEEPEEQKTEEIEVVDEEQIETDDNDIGTKNDSSDQTSLF